MKTCKRNHQYEPGKGCPECNRLSATRATKKWQAKNKERLKEYKARYLVEKCEHEKAYKLAYYQNNRDKILEDGRKWYSNNREHVRVRSSTYIRHRRATDPNFKLAGLLRTRLNNAIKKGSKAGSFVTDLGCSIPELKTHLESKFLPGMTWENHGQYGWHIDHIIPLSSFDLTDREQLLKACHYTNLQPLWWKDNLTKSDNYDPQLCSTETVSKLQE